MNPDTLDYHVQPLGLSVATKDLDDDIEQRCMTHIFQCNEPMPRLMTSRASQEQARVQVELAIAQSHIQRFRTDHPCGHAEIIK